MGIFKKDDQKELLNDLIKLHNAVVGVSEQIKNKKVLDYLSNMINDLEEGNSGRALSYWKGLQESLPQLFKLAGNLYSAEKHFRKVKKHYENRVRKF